MDAVLGPQITTPSSIVKEEDDLHIERIDYSRTRPDFKQLGEIKLKNELQLYGIKTCVSGKKSDQYVMQMTMLWNYMKKGELPEAVVFPEAA